MKFLDVVITANRNLFRSKLRTILTILAIFVGGFTLTLTTALNTGATQYLDRQLGNVSVPGVFQVVPKTDFNPFATSDVKEYDPAKKQSNVADILNSTFTHDDVNKLAKLQGVEKAVPLYNVGLEYVTRADGSSKKYQVQRYVQDLGLNLDLSAGRLLKGDDTNSVVLPEEYLSILGFKNAHNSIGAKLTIGYKDLSQKVVEHEVEVVGVMKKTFFTAGSIYGSLDAVHAVAAAQGQENKFFGGLVTFKDVTEKTDENVLKNRIQDSGNYTAMSMKERIGTVSTIVQAITAGLSVVGIIALLAASFGIINTLLMSVYERTQEVGLMKALGMRRSRVFSLFAVEAMLVGFWGSVVAIGAAEIASILVNRLASATFLKDFEGFTLLVINPAGALFVLLVIMLIAFVAGTFPAIKASRLNPIDALRSE